jgi:hypothetical protein
MSKAMNSETAKLRDREASYISAKSIAQAQESATYAMGHAKAIALVPRRLGGFFS